MFLCVRTISMNDVLVCRYQGRTTILFRRENLDRFETISAEDPAIVVVLAKVQNERNKVTTLGGGLSEQRRQTQAGVRADFHRSIEDARGRSETFDPSRIPFPRREPTRSLFNRNVN